MSTGTVAEKVAGQITDLFPKDVKAELDPLTILMIISVIISFIRMLQACDKGSADVRGLAENVSSTNKFKARREIRRILGIKNMRFGTTLYDSVVEYGKTADPKELELLFNEIL